jgi:FixJ family two-component response regulator
MSEQQWVAIIDDDESLRTSIVRVLRSAGIQASDFDSAEAFLSRAAGSEPTCVVLDIHLGVGLTGFEFQERLESEGRALPIIFVTGEEDFQLPTRREPGAAADYLRKPFGADELIARVRRHLRGDLGATRSPPAIPEDP